MVARLVSTLLGVVVCLPVSAGRGHDDTEEAGHARAAAPPGTTTRTVSTTTTGRRRSRRPAYSATAANARRATLATARASARARERTRLHSLAQLQEAMTPQFKTDANGEIVPDVRAAAAIVFDPATGQVLYEENSQDKRSIASITKVMTALVYLEDNPDLNAGDHRRAQRRVRRLDDLPARRTTGSRRASCCTCC